MCEVVVFCLPTSKEDESIVEQALVLGRWAQSSKYGIPYPKP